MAWLGDREFWVNLIGYASIVSAAIFGLLALFTDYKKEGRITRWGRLYAGGIALSAVFAMTSAVLQKRISADEAAAGQAAATRQRDEQQAQFKTQLDHFGNLTAQMRQVNQKSTGLLEGMTRSINTQRMLLTSAQRGMVLTSRLGVQQRESTGRLLHGLWDESSRVTGDSITALVIYSCLPRSGQDFPRILPQDATAHLTVGPMAVATGLRAPLNTFSMWSIFRGPAVAHYVSSDQQVTVDRTRLTVGGTLNQYSRFLQFRAEQWRDRRFGQPRFERWRDFERPENWEGAAIELVVEGFQPGIVATAAAAVPDSWAVSSRRDFMRRFVVPPNWREGGDLTISVLPCHVGMIVLVNGREVAEAWGVMAELRRGDESHSGRVVVKFPIVQTYRGIFPRFSQDLQAPRRQRSFTSMSRP